MCLLNKGQRWCMVQDEDNNERPRKEIARTVNNVNDSEVKAWSHQKDRIINEYVI